MRGVMVRDHKISKKERNLFWVGTSVGIVSGIIGNFLVLSYYEFSYNPSPINFVIFFIFLIITFGGLLFIDSRIKSNQAAGNNGIC